MIRNTKLADKVKRTSGQTLTVEAPKHIPVPNTVNRQGSDAYALPDEIKLLSMLNTLKLDDQFYRTDTEQVKDLRALIDKIAKKDPYFVAQCVIYSRCLGEGMRSVNHAAAIFLAKYIAGSEWADRFYSTWNKKNSLGGCIYRPDDMYEIAEAFKAYTGKNITNAMKRGFRRALENMDTYSLLKYKGKLIDIINLVHPNPLKSNGEVMVGDEKITAITAIIRGLSVSADTWEANQSEAGRIVADAKKEGLISNVQAEQLLQDAKQDNWKGLLEDRKLGVLACLRNLRNIIKTNPSIELIRLVRLLLENDTKIREQKIMPYQIDIAREIMLSEFGDNATARLFNVSLLAGYEKSVPNLAELLIGKTLVILDVSGSMSMDTQRIVVNGAKTRTSSMEKGALITATIAKATNADVIVFGGTAAYVKYDPNQDIFTMARRLHANMGATNLSAAWKLASERRYDRIILLSDNEANKGKTYDAYTAYVNKCGQPYVYSVDLASYGTTQIAGPKVTYLYGYGFNLFDSIASGEYNAASHIDKVRQIVI